MRYETAAAKEKPMVVVDIVIVVLLVLALLGGLRVGLFRGLGWWLGIAAGAAVSPWVVPIVLGLVPDQRWRSLAVIATVLVLLALGASLGLALGSVVRRGADKIKLGFFERLAGGLLGAAAMALAVIMAGSAIASAGLPVVSSAVASSTILRTIERMTPDPVTEALARLRSLVVDDALPAIGGVIDDVTQLPHADVDTGDPALDAAASSVARISGMAYACGAGSTGTGFVVDDDLIVTNAHVVAGAETVMVELPNERAVDGQVVYFDAVDDLAVIAAQVDADALTVVPPIEVGAGAVVQGYPYGGPFTLSAATVVSMQSMPVDDIYGSSQAPREVYTLSAEVRPGNSGGPLLTESGEVAGVIFARDEVNDQIGYAMTSAELLPVLAEVDASTGPVSTGSCTS